MPHDPSSLENAFTALKTFDYGGDASALGVIDTAVVAAHGDEAERSDLERRLAALLGEDIPRAAGEYICRTLSLIGTAASVPALAARLTDSDRSHMARFALVRIPGPEAAAAIRGALAKVDGDLRIGMISSLASRRDASAVPQLAALLAADPRTAVSAAGALGTIRSAEAIAALGSFTADFAPADVRSAIIDARLACAEALLGDAKRTDALILYRSLAAAAAGKPADKWIELAATRGITRCLDASPSGAPS